MKKNLYPGRFIVFEGIDGSGQSTQSNLLKNFLMEKGQRVYETKEPTANLIGGLIRAQLTNSWKSSAECLQLLFAADRAYHLEKEIIPLLKKNIIVISDRYFFSTVAYGACEIEDWDWLLKINERFLMPDLIFLLKVSPRVCLERIKQSRFEIELFEKEELLAKVWQNYEKLAKKFKNVYPVRKSEKKLRSERKDIDFSNRVYIINGERSIEEIFEEIKKIVCEKLELG